MAKLPLHQPHPSDTIEHIESLDGVRVTLVNAPVREQSTPNVAPQGPALLAARLEALGASVRILDLNAKRPVYTRQEARWIIQGHASEHAPHLWGLSGLITTLAWQTDLATYIREAQPDTHIVSGGGLATQFRERLLKWIPELDGVGHSEGDDIIVAMAHDAKHRQVKRVYHGDRPLDLDAVPLPAWHLLEEREQYQAAPIWGDSAGNSSAAPFSTANSLNTVSSRGCPFACVAGDTLIALPDRVFRPRDELLGPRVDCPEPGHVHHLGANEPRMVSQGPKPCIRLGLSTGPSVTLTPDHKVLCVEGDMGAYRRADKLEPGDWVVIEGGQNAVKHEVPLDPVPEYPVNPINGPKYLSPPDTLTEDLAWVLGVLVGDGCLPRDGRAVTHFAVKPNTADLPERVRRAFGIDLAVRPMTNTQKCEHGWLYSGQARAAIEHGVGITPDNKLSVPEKIFRSPARVCRAFLEGLYAADGDVKCEHHGKLTTMSRRLADDVAALITWIGDAATIREYDATNSPGKRYYVDWFSKEDGARKVGRPSVATQIPTSFRLYRSPKSGRILPRTASPNRVGVSRAILTEWQPDHVLLTPGWTYAQVTSIEDAGEVEVFDVEAPSPHRFSANTLAVHNCRFCFRGAQGERNYGVRSAQNVAAEMRWLRHEYGVSFVGLLDDNCMVSPKRLAEFPKHLPSDVAWGTHGRLDEAADAQRVNDMAASGCQYIGFGAESASPRVLESMGKGGRMFIKGVEYLPGAFTVPLTMTLGVRNVHAAGMHANLTWIMGWPGETLLDLKHTVAFMLWQRDLVGHDVNTSLFIATAYPGTEMWKHPHVQKVLGEKFGITGAHDDALRSYVLELNDATKLLTGKDGSPVNFSAMPDRTFMKVREYVEAGETEKVMWL